jgi:hypothetical protein
MDKIINDVKINLLVGDQTRLSKSQGCIEAAQINGVRCSELTFVPKEPWSSLNKVELKNILCSGKSNYQDVSLIKLPRNIRTKFKDLAISNCINIQDINYCQNSEEFKLAREKLLKFLSKNNLADTPLTPHSIYFGQPNLGNNTFNTKENVYIGMHLDSWEGELFQNRKNARNRICINLGNDSRYLMFYNVSLFSMATMANFETKSVSYDINMIYKKFAQSFPEIPIYRLEVKPYEAYIAPTEFIIHDGSSWNSTFPDINLVVRGRFHFENSIFFTTFSNYLNYLR